MDSGRRFLFVSRRWDIMGRKPRGGYTATIKYVSTPEAVERYARVLEILLRAKKRLEARKAQEGGDQSER